MSKKSLDMDKLPYKESMTKGKDGWGYNSIGSDDCHKVNGKYPWTHVQRVLNKYKGKSANKAFTYFCSIVPKYQQRWFWDELNSYLEYGRKFRGYRWGYWFVDKNQCIQYKKPKKEQTEHVIYSYDIRWGYVDVKYIDEEVRWWKNGYRYDGTEYTVVEGEIFKFKKKDAAYHKCFAEQASKKRKAERAAEIEARKVQLSFLTREEIESKDNKYSKENIAIDIIKRDSHGFNENSFTNNNGRLND